MTKWMTVGELFDRFGFGDDSEVYVPVWIIESYNFVVGFYARNELNEINEYIKIYCDANDLDNWRVMVMDEVPSEIYAKANLLADKLDRAFVDFYGYRLDDIGSDDETTS